MNEDETKPPKRQPVYPLFLVGGALMVFGFYLALSADAGEHSSGPETVDVEAQERSFARVPDDLDPSGIVGLELTFSDTPRRWRVDMRQSSVRVSGQSADSLETSIRFRLVDQAVEGAAHTFDRTYEDVSITISEKGEAVAPAISEQVSGLVESASHRVVYASNGRLERHELRSAGGASLRQVLALLEDAATMLAVQSPREPVNVGEPWSYGAPFSMEHGEGSTVSGRFEMSNTLVGIQQVEGRRLAVVKQDLQGSGTGTIAREDQPPLQLRLNGAGRAVFWIDLDAGALHRAELTVDQVSAVDAGGVQTTTTITMERDVPQG